jgi:sporulation protein YlmC with PRC-barrel domain
MSRNSVYEAVDTTNLTALSQLGDYKVAGDHPDVRDWDVYANDGKKIGKVDDLLVDRNGRDVRYLAVDVDRGFFASLTSDTGHVLIPVDEVRIEQGRRVDLTSLTGSQAGTLQRYDLGMLGRSGGSYGGDTDRTDRMDRGDRMGNEREARLTLSEEELNEPRRR